MIRLWLYIPAVRMRFEVRIPSSVSLYEVIPYLNQILEDEFTEGYIIPNDAWFLEENSGLRVSGTVTLSNQNIEDGMCLYVY